jgi:hypothetical protein
MLPGKDKNINKLGLLQNFAFYVHIWIMTIIIKKVQSKHKFLGHSLSSTLQVVV